jgi:Subtilase family
VPPRELCRRLSLFVALPAILVASVSGATVAARRAVPAAGNVRLIVAADRRGETRVILQQAEALGAKPVRLLGGPRLIALRVPRREARLAGRRLAKLSGVRFVERNRALMRTTGFVQAVPTDPLWPKQWGPALIGAPAAWSLTMGSPHVVIAMIDTGVDSSQPDLRGALVSGYNFVDGNNDPSDDNGHGTRTAGIVAARVDNGVGISGVCPRCSVMPVKVVDKNGSATWLNVASGITWAADHGANIISLSLGGGPSDTVAAAVRYAQSKGVLVVAAAGNNGNSQPFYPAAYPGVLSVGGTEKDGQLYPWSNRGSWVAVAAPGCDTTTFVGSRFGRFCGTSASAPVVAGLAGLALSYSPTSSAEEIERAIVFSAHHIAGVAGGRVDAAGTLAKLGATFRRRPSGRRLARDTSASSSRSSVKKLRPAARGRASVSRGALRAQWHFRLAVAGGRVAATLHSSKARSCLLSLRSAAGIWLSSTRGHSADSLVARVAGGKYLLDVQCTVSRARPASLTVRARFPKHRGGLHRRRAGGARQVPVAIRFKPI